MRLDLSVLNDEQKRAVASRDKPLLVLAGAGTGKTRVIVYRIADLIREGVAPDRILGITFTNKAAREMVERLLRMYPDLDPRPWLSTFHSLGFRLLRAEHEALGYRERFPIYDESDAVGLLTEILRELGGVQAAEAGRDRVRYAISRWKTRLLTPDAALDEATGDDELFAARAYSRYQDRLRALHAVDFDDLILEPVRLLREDEGVRERWGQRFEHVLVDEYQDTNTSQYHLARLLAGDRENICVVGDDDQSIYAFRGAEIEKILSFRRDFPRAEVVTLERNYRSVGTILDAANAVIRHNPRRHEKRLRSVRGSGAPIPLLTLEDEHAEAEEVVSQVLARRRNGVPLAHQAVLMRSAIQARPLEEKLRFHDVAYTIIGGQSFFDRREIRDVLAYLRLVVDPGDDIAALRILNVPRRGWGKGSRERLDTWARESGGTLLEALESLDTIDRIAVAARDGGKQLLLALRRAREALFAGTDAASLARDLLATVGFDRALEEKAKDHEDLDFRRRGVHAVLEAVSRHEERRGPGHLDDFLKGITLAATENDEEEGDQLTLLTFHGAKGLEFRSVTLVGVEDQLIPHHRAVAEESEAAEEEERRLFYVAMTRAKDELVLTRAASRRRFGQETETEESRFAAEIPAELLQRRDVRREAQTPLDEEATKDRIAELRARFGG